MKVIIAGSRGITAEMGPKYLAHMLKSLDWEISEVVCGCCRGMDQVGSRWASEQGIPVKHFPAQWDTWGRSAGPRRNAEMAEYADALIAVRHQGNSTGTGDMITQMRRRQKPVQLLTVRSR